MLICLVQLLVVSTKIDLSLIGNTFQQIIISAAIHWDYSLGSYRFLDPKYKTFSQHSKFSQGNSLISHIGEPTPLNWSRVQRKVVRHNVSSIAHSTRSQKHSVLSIFVTNSLRKHVYGIFQPKSNCIWNKIRQKGHPVKWIQQYSLDSVRENYLVLLSPFQSEYCD